MSEIKMHKPHLVHKRFQLPEGCSVDSIVVREIDGQDEREVGQWLAARGSTADDSGIAIMDEQLRIALVGVNDQAIQQPYLDMDKWNVKTRRCLLEAFSMLNGLDDSELAVFLGAAKDLNSEQPAAAVLSEEELQEEIAAGA